MFIYINRSFWFYTKLLILKHCQPFQCFMYRTLLNVFIQSCHNQYLSVTNDVVSWQQDFPSWCTMQIRRPIYCMTDNNWCLTYDKLRGLCCYYAFNITVTSSWARMRLKLPASRLFTQPFIQAQIKEHIKAPRHRPLCGEFTNGQ